MVEIGGNQQEYRLDYMRPETVLDLGNIRSALVRMEDTILFDLIERAQFAQSNKVYEKGAFPNLGHNVSFLEWMLRETECTHSQLRRYQCPDEYPFFQDALVEPVLPALHYPTVLTDLDDEVNVNSIILDYYVKRIVPAAAASPGEQPENYGSCTLSDIQALQALSRRIHFGKFVAESKFQEQKEKMTTLIRARDTEGILGMITKPEVEAQVLERVRVKAENYTLDPHTSLRWSQKTQGKLDPEVVVRIYQNCVIPLTKKVEVDYLLKKDV